MRHTKITKCLGIIIFLISSFQLQAGVVKGTVKDSQGTTLPMASVFTSDRTHTTLTDLDGNFALQLEKGTYTLTAQMVGFEKQSQQITVSNAETVVNFTLSEKVTQLEEVQIEVQTKGEQLKEEPYSVEIVDVTPLKTQNLDVNQVLNRQAGVRIRESGGLGSDFNFSLNGFTGNQVRFFVDGIPMDNFGSSLSLNNLPVNLISRIEVYKGVVPIHLGSDALGGAVNIVTNKSVRNFVDASYSIGSFNTHRAAVVSRYHFPKSGIFLNANAFYNYSDNDYKIDVQVVDLETGKYGDPEKIRRFHDAYQSQSAQLELGVRDKKYADQLMLGMIVSGNHKEVQTGYNMTDVAGQVFREDKVFIPSIKYQKKDILPNLDINAYANYNRASSARVDTGSYDYNWYGEAKERGILNTSGEITWYKTFFFFNDESSLANINLTYRLNKKHSLSLNNTFSSFRRVGEDTVTYGSIPFKDPNTLNKNVLGLSYNISSFNDKLKTIFYGKYFIMDAMMHESSTIGEDNQELEDVNGFYRKPGVGIATSYHFKKNSQLKVSFENTYRLPDGDEMFGNGLLVLPAPSLGPERSKNFNLVYLGRSKLKTKHEFLYEIEYLYRISDDMIRQQAVGVTSYYENLVAAKSNIVEGGIKYNFDKLINFEINATYQNVINNQDKTETGKDNPVYEDRIPNRPYLFGNAGLGIHFKNVLHKNNTLALNWSTSYIESFYLKWPSQGGDKYDIPRQVSHSTGISYSIKDGTYNLSLMCTNIFDKALFDNFMLQKPGRAFSLKFRYYIQSKS